MSERIGIFGGTFDPVHKGHVAAAECFISRKALDILYIIPNHVPPLKDSESAPPLDRRKMGKRQGRNRGIYFSCRNLLGACS